MKREREIERLRDLGFEVERANDFDYFVSGFGIETYLNIEVDEGWDALLDEEGHAERVKQAGESKEETRRRYGLLD